MSQEYEKAKKERHATLLIQELRELIGDDLDMLETVVSRLDTNISTILRKGFLHDRKQLPYYTEDWARALQLELEKLESGQTTILQFHQMDYKNKSVITIYNMINNAWMWLRDNHPEKDRWHNLYRKFSIAKRPNCVRVIPIEQGKGFKTTVLAEDTTADKNAFNFNALQDEIDKFVAEDFNGRDEIIFIPTMRISLSDEQVETLKDYLADNTEITSIIDKRQVKLLRRAKK